MDNIFWMMLVLVLVVLAPISGGYAQEYPYYVSGHLFYALEMLDEGHTQEKFRRPIAAGFDNTFGVEIRGGMIISECWFAEGLLEYALPFKDGSDDKTVKTDLLYVGANLKGILWFLGSVEPYALFGMGLMGAREMISYNDESSTDIDWAIGMRLGFGADIYLIDTVSVGIENSYVFGTGKTSQIRYLTLSLGISYHF